MNIHINICLHVFVLVLSDLTTSFVTHILLVVHQNKQLGYNLYWFPPQQHRRGLSGAWS